MPPYVCMVKNERVYLLLSTACERMCVCACVYLIDVLLICCQLPFPLPSLCQSAADDGQLICGPEISVLEKELCRRRAAKPS